MIRNRSLPEQFGIQPMADGQKDKDPENDTQAMASAEAAASKITLNATVYETQGLQTGIDKDRMLGEFRILRRLGKGGMAEVYLADQTSLHRQVAVKVLRPELCMDQTYLKRFRSEAHTVAGLNHPNIVQVYTVGEAQGTHYIAQEYVQGQSLRDFISRKGPPDAVIALRLIRQMASALEAAHNAGIVHRDIKPENILLTRRGDVKVADFGLAKQSGKSVDLTQSGATMGTPLYMSPEQINGGEIDHRSDIYSLGITCFHLLAGEPPFRGESHIRVAMQHLQNEPEELTKLRSDLPAALCKIVHRMMAKNPDSRYSSATSILRDLKRLQEKIRVGEGDSPEAFEPSKTAQTEIEDDVDLEPTPASNPKIKPAHFTVRWLDVSWKSHAIRLSIALFLVAGSAAGIGWALRLTNPLTNLPIEDDLPRLPTAKEQFEFAQQQPYNERAWKAVLENFPSDLIYRPRAEVELVIRYLESPERSSDAEAMAAVLSSYSNLMDSQSRAAGLAAQAVLNTRKGNYNNSVNLIKEMQFMPGHYQNLDSRLKTLVHAAAETNANTLKTPEARAELQKMNAPSPTP